MSKNVTQRLDADESDDKTLNDFVDIGGIDTLQLDEDESGDTDHWGQAIEHYDEPECGGGEKRQCQRCGSRHEVALVATTASTSADNWEEFYQCQNCDAEGSFRVENGSRSWTGAIDYPDKSPITDGGTTLNDFVPNDGDIDVVEDADAVEDEDDTCDSCGTVRVVPENGITSCVVTTDGLELCPDCAEDLPEQKKGFITAEVEL